MSLDADLEFLRGEFGFQIVREHVSRPGERFTIVLESSPIRIELENELGVRVLYFSSLESPRERHVDNALLNFIEHRHRLSREDDPAARLRRHLPEILAAFATPRPREWWNAYAAYRDERLREMRKK